MPYNNVAQKIQALYALPFGGKASGRFRIPEKLVKDMMGRKRLYPEDRTELARALFELGFVLIDMDSFFVVMSANSFVNYRRVSKDVLEHL